VLTRIDLLGPLAPPFTPGLVVIAAGEGELETMLALPNTAPIKIDRGELLATGVIRQRQIHDASVAANAALQHGVTPLVYIESVMESTDDDLDQNSTAVSSGLAAIITGIKRRPAFILVVGSEIDSAAIAEVLGVTGSPALGEIAPGVSVRMSNDSARFPNMPVVSGFRCVVTPAQVSSIIVDLRGGR